MKKIIALNVLVDVIVVVLGIIAYSVLSQGQETITQNVIMCFTIATAMLITHVFWTFTKDKGGLSQAPKMPSSPIAQTRKKTRP